MNDVGEATQAWEELQPEVSGIEAVRNPHCAGVLRLAQEHRSELPAAPPPPAAHLRAAYLQDAWSRKDCQVSDALISGISTLPSC